MSSPDQKKEEVYCVLYLEGKGYYLSKIEIAETLNFNPVRKGSKKDCENYIKINNNGTEPGLMF